MTRTSESGVGGGGGGAEFILQRAVCGNEDRGE